MSIYSHSQQIIHICNLLFGIFNSPVQFENFFLEKHGEFQNIGVLGNYEPRENGKSLTLSMEGLKLSNIDLDSTFVYYDLVCSFMSILEF